MTISKAGVSDCMQYIDPQAYIDMNDDMISKLYSVGDDKVFLRVFM